MGLNVGWAASLVAACMLLPSSASAKPRTRSVVPVPDVIAAKPPSVTTPAVTDPPPPVEESNIVVTIRHMNGEKETFSKEVDSMDLVFEPTGRLNAVHLILMTHGEKDTHRWYLLQNLAAFSYRFLSVAGKGKVRLRVTQPVQQADDKSAEGIPKVPAIIEKDFR